jgi:TatD DNase family protein
VITEDLWKHSFPPPDKFDVDKEIDFIDELARTKQIIAVGECGLDKHYLTDAVSMNEQERVLRKLMRVAKKHDLPIILHTRKQEERTLELLLEEGVVRADIHCFCGKPKLGLKYAEAGYYLSIPSAVEKAGSPFRRLVEALPMDKVLTETDCPYMGPDKGQRNDPTTVVRGVAAIAEVKGISPEEAKLIIRANFEKLFRI